MAETRWTPEQQQVIDSRGRNLLVSAAAGSGKTAVLVERIIRMVTDRESPVDIDRLLVMTFTNAAAAEMRERIGDALEERLEQNPGDANLERQTTLIHHAQITTIDSFCLSLLREHFNEIRIDPGFRIGEEGELLLIQTDVMKELLEDYYARSDGRFFRFVDTYASGKADGGLEDYILQVWRFSQSNPWPKEWIETCRRELDGAADDFSETRWMRFLTGDVKLQAAELAGQMEEAISISSAEDGPQSYLPTLLKEAERLHELENAKTYEEIHAMLSEPIFDRLSAARAKNIDPEKKERVTAIRNRVKDAVKKMAALYAPGDLEHIVSDMEASREPVLMLLELAEEFTARYQAAKEEKNLVDFNDLEHFALRILTGDSPDHTPGPSADELAGFYREILVDEYQDSNLVQETLIRCISRERFGEPNVFMVGDVKQSIYRFRLARPELFMEKYESYTKEEGTHQKIELHKNFRSRPEVLSGINDLFYAIMTREFGNIPYTEDAALYPGADYPATEREGQANTELLLLDTSDPVVDQMDEDRADYTAKEAEARLIAAKIRELTDPVNGFKTWNAKEGRYEPLKRSGIVILLRSMSGWAEEFVSVLNAEGIPAFAESRTGYFTAVEVETVLNMLSLIDNPMQDIPLAGVLRSPIGGLDDEELAVIMAAFKKNPEKGQDGGLYGAVKMFLKEDAGSEKDPAENRAEMDGSVGDRIGAEGHAEGRIGAEKSAAKGAAAERDGRIRRKLSRFRELLSVLRNEAEYLTVHRLLYRIFELTGYYDYVSAMPAGKTRQANLDMLIEKAAAYEKTSYQSLFDFIRYIEKLKKYNTDFGEASRVGENDDTVRIMSIHKSKGLEFPVVFLAGAGKLFNRQDSRGKILIDADLGIATDFFDTEQKLKAPTLKKNVLSRRANLESMGEELRILYVAMTRAREKLIVTAGDKNLDNRLEKWKLPAGKAPFTCLSAAGSYLDWFLMAAENTKNSIGISRTQIVDLLAAETRSQMGKERLRQELARLRETDGDAAAGDIGALIMKPYPYEADTTLHAKMSVSELKERGQFVDDGESDFLPTIPKFMREGKENAGGSAIGTGKTAGGSATGDAGAGEAVGESVAGEADKTAAVRVHAGGTFRGTAYHRVLELLDFKRADTADGIRDQLADIREQGLMPDEALDLIHVGILVRFFRSPLAARMRRADENGKLYKERQFVMGIPAREMDEADSDEPVLIQGIIDAWFEEDDGIVLVDYKTDRVPEGGEKILLDRYRLQMVYYSRALSQITGKNVKQTVIYSLSLQKEIEM